MHVTLHCYMVQFMIFILLRKLKLCISLHSIYDLYMSFYVPDIVYRPFAPATLYVILGHIVLKESRGTLNRPMSDVCRFAFF